MNTPIRDFVKKYAESESIRLHMPGHKGKDFLGCEKYDITEIDDADVLYSAKGIIKESEENASELFGTYRTFYSAEGSSLCIKAMLSMVTSDRKSGQQPQILAARNVHKAFVYACALLDLDVDWIYNEKDNHICSCNITSDDVRKKLNECDVVPSAVYVTSPDYLGHILDIKAISAVCDEYGVPLLVDNAHGAYLHFLEKSLHPIDLGAYMCCDSAHKTLPVLTGGAYLHLSEKAKEFACIAESTLSVFASTSPSYLILHSLDLCNKYLSDDYQSKLKNTVLRLEQLKDEMFQQGYKILPSEPLKLVFDAVSCGLTVENVVEHLRRHKIEIEFYDDEFLVMMFTCENTENDFKTLSEAFSSLKHTVKCKNEKKHYNPEYGEKVMSIREAIFSKKELVATDIATDRICASPMVSCPPAVPIVISGERTTGNAVKLMKRYGIDFIEVVKE